MISVKQARKSDRLMRATTSLTVAEFDGLADRLEMEWAAARAGKTADGKPRQHRPGAGPKSCLGNSGEKLFFILLCYKAYPSRLSVTSKSATRLRVRGAELLSRHGG